MEHRKLSICITGADGFIGSNLKAHLDNSTSHKTFPITKKTPKKDFNDYISNCDVIFHLAGENRNPNKKFFKKNNTDLTSKICNLLIKRKSRAKLIFSSSTHAAKKTAYGKSKFESEKLINALKENQNISFKIYRLPGVFGKWSKPNYNSVVATFCHNVINNKKLEISDPELNLDLLYIDDLIDLFQKDINLRKFTNKKVSPKKIFRISLGNLAKTIMEFRDLNSSMQISNFQIGIRRALFATYLSFLNENQFYKKLNSNRDSRGEFLEIFRTSRSGQFSIFTANPKETRGSHFHHTKNEVFFVLHGTAEFKFHNLKDNTKFTKQISGDDNVIIRSIPGWAHSVKNVGKDTLKVFLWTNENYNENKPDTYFFNLDEN